MVAAAETTVQIKSPLGLNLHAAVTLAQVAEKFAAHIVIQSGKNQANAKSVMDLITLEAGQGSMLHISTEGDDAVDAIATLRVLFERRLGPK